MDPGRESIQKVAHSSQGSQASQASASSSSSSRATPVQGRPAPLPPLASQSLLLLLLHGPDSDPLSAQEPLESQSLALPLLLPQPLQGPRLDLAGHPERGQSAHESRVQVRVILKVLVR